MKSCEVRRREAWPLIAMAGGTVAALLLLLAAVKGSTTWLMFSQTIAAFVTAGIVWWYTKETQRLREAAQQQIEVQQRPFVILTPEAPQGVPERLKVQNSGNRAAINIRIVPTIRPILVNGESVAGPVIPMDQHRITQGLAETQRRYGEENPYYLRFPLRNASITDGFKFTVEYRHVALERYETVEKLWPRGFEIIHSGKRIASSS